MAKDWKDLMDDEIDLLRRGRDELRVQIHLGAAEARDAWDKLEKSWHQLEGRLKRIGQVGQDSADDVEEAAKLLVDEIKSGYKHLRDVL
jgi:uncharacterized protein YjbJ (UPF0337 family)